jgi:hypothetical protein
MHDFECQSFVTSLFGSWDAILSSITLTPPQPPMNGKRTEPYSQQGVFHPLIRCLNVVDWSVDEFYKCGTHKVINGF